MMQRIESQLSEATIKALDGWRDARTPAPSRSEAVRLLLEELLLKGRGISADVSHQTVKPLSINHLGAIFTLERVSGFGPVKFRAMYEAGVDAQEAISDPDLLPFTGRIGEKLRGGILNLSAKDIDAGRERAIDQLERAGELSATILVHGDPRYPARVYKSNNPVPVLYVRGDPAVCYKEGTVAIVGSRNTREPYESAIRRFATVAVRNGKVVVSGFAIGADSMGHCAAVDAGGHTICVMPCGLDKVFPPENRRLWEELIAYQGAVFVSEFGFGLRASSLLLRKRNKLIVSFAQGILVAQSSLTGGAMNAYRFGREQNKPVATFRTDGSIETSGNALIEEDERTGRIAFELTDKSRRLEAWLQQLSS